MDINELLRSFDQSMSTLQQEQEAYLAKHQITVASSDRERVAVFGEFLESNTSLHPILAQAKEITDRCVNSIKQNIKADAAQGLDSMLSKAQDPSVDISERIDILEQLIEEYEQPEDRKPVILCLVKIMGDPNVADQHKENASDILFYEFVEATSSDMLARLNEVMEIEECKQFAALYLISKSAESVEYAGMSEELLHRELFDSLGNAFNIVYKTWNDDSQIKIYENLLLDSIAMASELINDKDSRNAASDFLIKMASRKDLSDDTKSQVLEILVRDSIDKFGNGDVVDFELMFRSLIELIRLNGSKEIGADLFFRILFDSDITENNIPVETLKEVMDTLVKAELAKAEEEDDESYVLIQEVSLLSDMVRENKHKGFALSYLMKIVNNPRFSISKLEDVAETLNKGGDTDKAIELFWRIFNHPNTEGWSRERLKQNLLDAGVDLSEIDKACLDLIKCGSFSIEGKENLINLLDSDVNRALALYEILKDSSLEADDKRALRADFIHCAQEAIGNLDNKELIVKLEGMLAEMLFACITEESESWGLDIWLNQLKDLDGHAEKYAQALLVLVENTEFKFWNRMYYMRWLQALKDQKDLALKGVNALLKHDEIEDYQKQELTEMLGKI